MARPARSNATRIPSKDENTTLGGCGATAAATPNVAKPRSSANSPSSALPASVVLSTMRPCDSAAAIAEPTPTAIEKQRQIGGDGFLVATDQRLDQRRAAATARRCRPARTSSSPSRPPQPRVGALMPDHRDGRCRDVDRDLEMRRTLAGRWNQQAGDPAGHSESHHQPGKMPRHRRRRAPPGRRRFVPVRMATKVAPSTSALAAGNSSHRK